MSLLETRDLHKHAEITSRYWPNGVAWIAKTIRESNMYKRMYAMSKEFSRVEGIINSWISGLDVTKSEQEVFLWERFLGIPDGDLKGNASADERRRHCQGKLSAEGVVNLKEFEWLLRIFGYESVVYPGWSFWPNGTDDRFTWASEEEALYTIVFEIDYENSITEYLPDIFPVDFPWVFGASNYNQMRSFIINSVIPAECNAVFVPKRTEESDVWLDTIIGPEVEDSTDADDEIIDTP